MLVDHLVERRQQAVARLAVQLADARAQTPDGLEEVVALVDHRLLALIGDLVELVLGVQQIDAADFPRRHSLGEG